MGKKREVNGLKKIGEVADPKKAASDRTKAGGLPGFKRIERTADKDREAQEAADELRAYVDEVEKTIPAYVEQAWECLAGDDVSREAHAAEFAEIVEEVTTHVHGRHSEVARTAAVKAYVNALVTHCPADKQMIFDCISGRLKIEDGQSLPGLVDLDVLETVEASKNGHGAVKIGNSLYRATDRSFDILLKILEARFGDAKQSEQEELEQASKQLIKASSPGFEEEGLLGGKKGQIGLSVLPFSRGDFYLPGGAILIKSDGKEIEVVDAVGPLEHNMLAIRTLGHRLPVEALKHEVFRDWLSEFLPKPKFDALRTLHGVTRRGLYGDKWREEREAEKKAYREECREKAQPMYDKATMDANEWSMSSDAGSAVMYFPFWRTGEEDTPDEEKYFQVYFLVERDAEGWIGVLETSDTCRDLFDESDFGLTDPGNRLSNLPYPLGPMLKTAYGIAKKNLRRASTTERQEAPEEAETTS